jgi:hypothetical protein
MSSSNLNGSKKKPDKGYRIIRLVNGEKLIAKISGSTTSKLILNRPMTIRGMTTNNPIMGVTKEFLILNDWLEHCSDNDVRIKLESVLTISNPDEYIEEAYDCQKEYLDTGKVDPRMEDVYDEKTPSIDGHKTIAELLEESSDDDDLELTGEGLKDFLHDFVNSIVNKAASKLEEEWHEDDVDKDRDDYGNDLDDWSPYPEDYYDD